LAAAGNHIIIGSTHPKAPKTAAVVEKVAAHAAKGGSVEASTNSEAVKVAKVVILTFPCAYSAKMVADFAAQLGDTTGKVVIDATNPFGPKFGLELDGIDSAGEEFAKVLPGAAVYKAFNTIGVTHMADPMFRGKAAQLLFAGPADEHQRVVEKVISGEKTILTRTLHMLFTCCCHHFLLLAPPCVPRAVAHADVGFKPEYVGPIRAARNLEHMAELWVHMTYKYKTHDDRGFAFGITEKA